MSIAELYRATGAVGPASTRESTPTAKDLGKVGGKSDFHALLTEQTQQIQSTPSLNLSQHAETRIRSRAIPWDAAIEKRINSGIDQARAKGSRETLILADDIAVIANVKSRTVITAMDKSQLKEKIFTNIDSAVLV
jgi:flagellar operon protein